jgi:two-component system chemotaxis sensor kinase CheA
MSQDVFFAELQQEFLSESSFLLEQYEEGMLALEGGSAPDEVMAQIFRVAHSIKGGAAAVGFLDLSKFAHVAEDLLSLLRVHPQLVNPEAVSLLLQAGDVFRQRITELQSANPSEDWDVSQLKVELSDMAVELGKKVGIEAPSSAHDVRESSALGQGQALAPETQTSSDMDVQGLVQDSLLAAPADEMVASESESEVIAAESLEAPEQEDHTNHELLAELMGQFQGDASVGVLADTKTPAEAPAQAVSFQKSTPAQEKPASQAAVVAKAKPSEGGGAGGGNKGKPGPAVQSIKVDTGRVDSVLDAVGEIVVLKNQLVHDEIVRSGENPRVTVIVDQLDKLVRELYDKTLSIRMTPLKSLFLKIQRLVRDVSLQLGKPVNLVLEGEETEVERTVFELLGDPMVHLVRNALDHGIEKPDARVAKGKPATASLRVTAKQAGGTVLIEIVDDGGGINRQKVLRKAEEKGLLPAGRDPESLRDEEVFQFIFAPGFSTADKVSDLSGRGVGLDVVRSNLERIHGKIDISSKTDAGSTFRLSIPLSTAITDGIVVAVGGAKFILPIHSIREIVRAVPSDYTKVSGMGRVVKIRETLIPVVASDLIMDQISKVKKLAGATQDLETEKRTTLRDRRGETMLIIIETLSGQAAFPVDDVLGQAQVVVKPLTAGVNIPEVSGAAIMGDGRTVLTLDPQALVQHQTVIDEEVAA